MRKAGDVYINNQPFPVNSYQRSTTEDMVAKFGSAEQGQTNLDLFKAKTQKSWKGGMFQKEWSDDEMAGYISGFHHNPLDQKLYLTPEMEAVTKAVGGMTSAGITAWCFFNGLLYIAFSLNAPSTDANGLVKLDLDTNTATGVTLPSAIRTASAPITSMVAHGTSIFIAGKSRASGSDLSFGVHRYDGNTTFVSIGGSTFRYLVSFNDRLYGMGLAEYHLITKEFTSSATTTKLKTVGSSDPGVNSVFGTVEYNGAVYIAKADGLFRYNGVDVLAVVNRRNNVSSENFQNLTVFNGRLYWSERGRIYEFDGVNITLITDMSDSYYIIDMQGGDDRLWISVRYNATSPSIFESDNFTDPIVTETYTYGLFNYNGVGFFEYKTKIYSNDQAHGDYAFPIQFRAIPVDGYISWFFPSVYLNASLETRSDGWQYLKQKLSIEFTLDEIGTTRQSEIIGSVLDVGYPSVPKTLNGVMVETENIVGEDNILLTVEARTRYKGVLSSWETVWRSDNVSASGAEADYYLHDQVYDVGDEDLDTFPLLFHSIEYRAKLVISGAITAIPKIDTLTLRYTLQPRMRRKWLIAFPIYGADPSDINTPTLGDGTPEERTANEIRSIIYDAYESKLPILFYDIDFSHVLDNDPTYIKGRDWIKDGDYLAFKPTDALVEAWANRRVQVVLYDDDQTQITLDETGQRISIGGDTDSPVLTTNEVRKSYAVYVRSVQNERVHISDENVNDENGYSDWSSELVVELVEA